MKNLLIELPELREPQFQERVGKPRVKRPQRGQMEWRSVDLESTLPAEHPARLIWEFVTQLDLSPWYAQIRAIEGEAGRDAIDPAILVALWLFATFEGVGSARALERLCGEHDAYRWICGGVSINYHTLADFRVGHAEWLDTLLTQSVAALMADGVVSMQRVAQDGKHVRASAGRSSFRRRATLEQHLKAAREQVAVLRKELESDPQATTKRQRAARERTARERQERVQKALQRLNEISGDKQTQGQKKKSGKRQQEQRASTTDEQARIMMMADGGFQPAYDVQFSTDTETQVIVGVTVNNQGNDKGQLGHMQVQLEERYGMRPREVLVDGGYVKYEDFEQVSLLGTVIYAPPSNYRAQQTDPYQPQPNDSPIIAAWRQRMATEPAQAIYKLRAATAECVNAIAHNRGLTAFRVRGLPKVKAVALWYALLHTLLRGRALRLAIAQV